jgi:predicted DNA-binding transcriptional regulator AlpA
MEIAPKYLTTKQAAAYCNISKKTLEHHRRNGTGPKYIKRSAKLLRYTQQWCDEWMEAGLCL